LAVAFGVDLDLILLSIPVVAGNVDVYLMFIVALGNTRFRSSYGGAYSPL
jgi:hypothetical protein